MIKRLFTWQFFIIAFPAFILGLIAGSTLSLFLYMKNIDVKAIKKDQEYLKEQFEILKKGEMINKKVSDYIEKARSMTDYNEYAVVVPEEEEGEEKEGN